MSSCITIKINVCGRSLQTTTTYAWIIFFWIRRTNPFCLLFMWPIYVWELFVDIEWIYATECISQHATCFQITLSKWIVFQWDSNSLRMICVSLDLDVIHYSRNKNRKQKRTNERRGFIKKFTVHFTTIVFQFYFNILICFCWFFNVYIKRCLCVCTHIRTVNICKNVSISQNFRWRLP